MTVASAQNRAGPFAGDNVSTQFDFNIPYQKRADIRVLRRVLSTGIESTLAHLSDYSLSEPGPAGRVTLASPLTTGTRLVIVRAPEPIQETDLIENSTYTAETIERALDYSMMVSQRAYDLISRALVLSDSDTPGSGAFNAGGNRITGLGNAVNSTDAVTLSQVQALVGSGGGGGGPATWPTTPIPQDILNNIVGGVLTAAEFQAVFAPINSQLGNLAASVLSQNSLISSINTSVGTINTTLIAQQAAIDLLEQLQGDGTEILTLINETRQEIIDGDTALATLISKIGAADGDGVSFLLNLSTAKISPTETLALRFGSITTQLAANAASINTEASVRNTVDTAIAQTIEKIGALTQNGTAFQLATNTVFVSPTESLSQRLNAIAVAINGANAAITNEASVRASADTSFASSLTTMQSTVSGFSVAIQQNATAINGVGASYSVKIDNNNRVSGFGLVSEPNNGAIVSTFNFNSDVFRIWNGSSNVAPFSVVEGVVYITNAKIGNAQIDDLSVTKLTAGTLNANFNIGTGKILLDDGSRILAMGVGFGTTNQFMIWSGPRPAGGDLSLCNESSATFYLTRTGGGGFDGELAVGILRNGAQTTNTQPTAFVEVGPFATEGGNKSVSWSYALHYIVQRTNNTQPGSGSTSLRLSRRLGTNAYVEIASQVVISTLQTLDNPEPGVWHHEMQGGGSWTLTDTNASMANFTYKAEITARTLPVGAGTAAIISTSQNISVLSVEV